MTTKQSGPEEERSAGVAPLRMRHRRDRRRRDRAGPASRRSNPQAQWASTTLFCAPAAKAETTLNGVARGPARFRRPVASALPILACTFAARSCCGDKLATATRWSSRAAASAVVSSRSRTLRGQRRCPRARRTLMGRRFGRGRTCARRPARPVFSAASPRQAPCGRDKVVPSMAARPPMRCNPPPSRAAIAPSVAPPVTIFAGYARLLAVATDETRPAGTHVGPRLSGIPCCTIGTNRNGWHRPYAA